MSQVHAQARTTPRTRAEIKEAPDSLAQLAERYNISRSTARKCKGLRCHGVANLRLLQAQALADAG